MKKTFTGTVVSAKMNKTVLVQVEIPKRHKLYGKLIKNTKKFLVHDEVGVIEGDKVLIEETVPFSKKVSWLVKERLI